MTQVTELDPVQTTVETAATTDRRRPGRVANVSPELIPMLRGQQPELIVDLEDMDQTGALRGLFFGILFSAPIWAAIAYAGSFFLSK